MCLKMNREIKFRAWNKIKKTMLLWHEFLVTNYMYDIVKELTKVSVFKSTEDWWYSENDITNDVILQQRTWLKDKNWVDIYEGDILRFKDDCQYYPRNYLLEIFYDNHSCNLKTHNIGSKPRLTSRHLVRLRENMWYVSIIWNKYNNPELIEKDPE